MIAPHYIVDTANNLKQIFKENKFGKPLSIITSPPYFDLLNYNNNRQQVGYGQKSYKDYLDVLSKIFQDCYDISTADATFWLVVDTFKKNKEVKLFPFDIVNKLKDNSNKTWVLRDIIIWEKEKNLPWNHKGKFKNQHEYILFFTKGDGFKFKVDRIREILDLKKWWKTYPERYNPNGKAPSNVWNFTTPIRGWGDSKQNHLCPFPFPLIEKIISLCSDENDWILDPFTGSGSVLAIASSMHRNSVGLDVNRSYRERFKTEVLIGAERYWQKRVKELEEAKLLFDDFKKTNRKLRKLKVVSNICEHLNKVNNHSFVYYAKDKANNDIEVVILQNGTEPLVDLESKALQDLIKQSKINPSVSIKNGSEFAQKFNKGRSYKYKFDRFFSYTSPCKMIDVLKNETKFEFMYSDIVLKLDKN